MLDSLAIMLAIVIPTIVAVLVFAWWFRESNMRARYMPDFVYSGAHRARRLVDPDPRHPVPRRLDLDHGEHEHQHDADGAAARAAVNAGRPHGTAVGRKSCSRAAKERKPVGDFHP
jgi:hypothetical protein